MKLKVNGDEQKYDKQSLTISELLTLAAVDNPDMVSVQLNGIFVDKSLFPSTSLKEGDTLDFLYFMGGGA